MYWPERFICLGQSQYIFPSTVSAVDFNRVLHTMDVAPARVGYTVLSILRICPYPKGKKRTSPPTLRSYPYSVRCIPSLPLSEAIHTLKHVYLSPTLRSCPYAKRAHTLAPQYHLARDGDTLQCTGTLEGHQLAVVSADVDPTGKRMLDLRLRVGHLWGCAAVPLLRTRRWRRFV